MQTADRIAFLRGSEGTAVARADHPILELSDEELQAVIGGADPMAVTHSTATGSYNSTANNCSAFCCEGVTTCCN
jgi:bacteriocin-like protein